MTSHPNAAAPVLVAERVTKSFAEGKGEVRVLDGVDLALAPGEVVALEGPSGLLVECNDLCHGGCSSRNVRAEIVTLGCRVLTKKLALGH